MKMDKELKDCTEEVLVTVTGMLGSFKTWGGTDRRGIPAGPATV